MLMTIHEYDTFKSLVAMNQEHLLATMDIILRKKYKKVITTEDYIIAEGDIPVGLVAHLDTVYSFPAREVYKDEKAQVIWSPDGLGADDRAGVLAIISIIADTREYRPWIFLTTNEEHGGIGASILAEEIEEIPPIKFLIELDRAGKDDCVFYDCGNADFQKYIEKFGFKTQKGSFSDISFIMPVWGICGVNLSIGYEDEHTLAERLYIKHWDETVRKVKHILSQEHFPTFEFIYDNEIYSICSRCHKTFYSFETIPVEKENFCIDCAVKYVDWCQECGQPYLISKKCKCAGVKENV
jgi:hypothetical protein